MKKAKKYAQGELLKVFGISVATLRTFGIEPWRKGKNVFYSAWQVGEIRKAVDSWRLTHALQGQAVTGHEAISKVQAAGRSPMDNTIKIFRDCYDIEPVGTDYMRYRRCSNGSKRYKYGRPVNNGTFVVDIVRISYAEAMKGTANE